MLKSSMPQRTKVVDMELSRPLADIDDLRGSLALRGVFRLHGAPLGYVRAPIIGDRCTAPAIGQPTSAAAWMRSADWSIPTWTSWWWTTRRGSVFDHAGHFDPGLDVGTVTKGGGDLEMFVRVLKEGHRHCQAGLGGVGP